MCQVTKRERHAPSLTGNGDTDSISRASLSEQSQSLFWKITPSLARKKSEMEDDGYSKYHVHKKSTNHYSSSPFSSFAMDDHSVPWVSQQPLLCILAEIDDHAQ